MKYKDIKNLKIQTLADYDPITKMFKYALSETYEDKININIRVIKPIDEHSKPYIRYYYSMEILGYIISDETDTIPNFKKIVLSYKIDSECDDGGNIDDGKTFQAKLEDLPKDAKNHFFKQLKNIQNANNFVKIGKENLPIMCSKVEYDNWKNETLTVYNIVPSLEK